MEDNHRAQPDLTPKEIDLIDQLRRKPLIMQRVQEILSLANAGDGPLKTADQIEEMLIQEMRQLGNATMTEWAVQAQQRVNQDLRRKDPTVRKRKKKV